MSEDQRESGCVCCLFGLSALLVVFLHFSEILHPFCRRIPRTIECELTADLVGTCVPGDVVTVTGEVRVAGSEDDPRKAKDQTTFLLYIFANSIAK
jgi:hypothetical protein